jgi:hypothetical protein
LNGILDVSGNIVVGGTVDGVDIAARDAVLTSTTNTANAALTPTGDGSGLTGTASGLTAALATNTVAKTGTGSTYATSISPALTTPKITTGLQDSAANLVVPFDTNQYFSGTFSDKVTVAGNTGTAITINANLGSVVTATLNGNATITLATPNAVSNRATSFTLILTNDATASRSVALSWGTFKYPGGSVSRSTGANEVDVWFFFTPDGGTTWYVTIPMKDLS